MEARRYRDVLAINRAIASAERYDDVLRLVVDRTAAFTGATACLLLLTQEDGLARVVRSVGIDPERLAGFAVPLSERIDGELCSLLQFQVRDGFVGVPVIGKRGLMGILAVYRQAPRPADGADDELISAFADQAAIALDGAERVHRLGEARAREALDLGEERLRAVIDSIPQLAWMARPDGYVTWYNRRWYEYTGATAQQVEGFGWQSVHDPVKLPDVLRRWKRALAAGVAFEMEFPLRAADGTFRRFLTGVLPVKDAQGAVVQWFGTNTDVTALVEAQEVSMDSDRRKSEFLAVLSHELRNPLTPIRNGLRLLERAAPGSEQASRAQKVIRRQTEQLTRLVDDLLDVTRISRGTLALQRTRVDVRDVVRETADDLRSGFAQAEVGLRVEQADRALWVDADATRLAQVVGNLLQNAVKFTPRGGAVVASLARTGSEAELRVRDDGIGLEPGVIEHMFEPFFQAEQGLARTRGGLGLGLAVVKSVVELHGGTVEARSDGTGRGAEFLVRLPLLETGTEAEALHERNAAPRAQPRTILVIEDNVDAGETLAELLGLAGHTVRVARDGRSGIALARELRPEVVLCDVGLPDVDGYEVARVLRRDEALRGTRLIALSGYAQAEDRRRARDAGFDAHVAKPPDLDELMQAIGSDS